MSKIVCSGKKQREGKIIIIKALKIFRTKNLYMKKGSVCVCVCVFLSFQVAKFVGSSFLLAVTEGRNTLGKNRGKPAFKLSQGLS